VVNTGDPEKIKYSGCKYCEQKRNYSFKIKWHNIKSVTSLFFEDTYSGSKQDNPQTIKYS